jgi:hypothetical protein
MGADPVVQVGIPAVGSPALVADTSLVVEGHMVACPGSLGLLVVVAAHHGPIPVVEDRSLADILAADSADPEHSAVVVDLPELVDLGGNRSAIY